MENLALRRGEVHGDAASLHLDEANSRSVFLVASQFNCLEMASPWQTPDEGITCYTHDKTQGPACAMSCPAATVFRNYFYDTRGQTGEAKNQINNMIDVHGLLQKAVATEDPLCVAIYHFLLVHSLYTHVCMCRWQMQNGYLLPVPDTFSAAMEVHITCLVVVFFFGGRQAVS